MKFAHKQKLIAGYCCPTSPLVNMLALSTTAYHPQRDDSPTGPRKSFQFQQTQTHTCFHTRTTYSLSHNNWVPTSLWLSYKNVNYTGAVASFSHNGDLPLKVYPHINHTLVMQIQQISQYNSRQYIPTVQQHGHHTLSDLGKGNSILTTHWQHQH